ncbi:MAG: VOC family protein [Anaerolineae bacterium]
MLNITKSFDKVQICIVVEDLQTAIKHYSTLMGIDSFAVYVVDTNELPNVTYRGQPADYRIEVAIADVGAWQLELLKFYRGESIYKEFIDQHGEAGIQHLGFFVKNPEEYESACRELVDRGYPHLQGGPILGTDRDGHFDYFDSRHDLGIIIELLDMPALT